jgi:hypothetical protein
MQPKFKAGLIVGAIGFFLNACISIVLGICGPFVSLVAGAVAGFFAARQGAPVSKGEGAKDGAVAGAVAGAFTLLAQVLASVAVLVFYQVSSVPLPFVGSAPSASDGGAAQFGYYVGGLGAGICFGLVGIVLAALAGAGAGYLGTPEKLVEPPNSSTPGA